ncbi:C-type lectin domain family 4 member M-like [Asterias amurensis]|uniref:C-type lectin domain family 4 member M-like n=1 Tax=Asterias amurensis TaxID=7602 RepID=UPI003AB5C579
MLASKLLGVVGVFMMADYAAVNGQCWKPCPPFWSQWRDKCYKMHGAEVPWEEGKQICVEMGGVMVVPQSEEELQHILNMCSCNFWIGCNDVNVEGTWVCLDGEGTIDVQDARWKDSEPNNDGGNEDCAVGWAAGWNDIPCDLTGTLICQRPVRAHVAHVDQYSELTTNKGIKG